MTRVSGQKTRQATLVLGASLDPYETPERLELFDQYGDPINLGGSVGIPPGGADNQVLTKDSAGDYDVAWANPATGIPPGGETNDVLTKASGAPYDVEWVPAPGGSGLVVKDEGVSLPPRDIIDFVGPNTVAKDDATNAKSIVRVNGSHEEDFSSDRSADWETFTGDGTAIGAQYNLVGGELAPLVAQGGFFGISRLVSGFDQVAIAKVRTPASWNSGAPMFGFYLRLDRGPGIAGSYIDYLWGMNPGNSAIDYVFGGTSINLAAQNTIAQPNTTYWILAWAIGMNVGMQALSQDPFAISALPALAGPVNLTATLPGGTLPRLGPISRRSRMGLRLTLNTSLGNDNWRIDDLKMNAN